MIHDDEITQIPPLDNENPNKKHAITQSRKGDQINPNRRKKERKNQMNAFVFLVVPYIARTVSAKASTTKRRGKGGGERRDEARPNKNGEEQEKGVKRRPGSGEEEKGRSDWKKG